MYVPGTENVAFVDSAFGALNVTAAGPLTRLHVVVSWPGGTGLPSSVAVPVSVVVPGDARDSDPTPAPTTGAALPPEGPSNP